MQPSKIWSDPVDVDAALSKIGVPLATLQEALKAGYIARMSRTENDAPAAAGLYNWIEIVRFLRDTLLPQGWLRRNHGNWPTVVNAKKLVAIAVASGNEGTGNCLVAPGTKRKKGPRTSEAVHQNLQLLLPIVWDELQPIDNTPPKSDGGQSTWLLLFCTTPTEVQAELSLPVRISKEGHINGWLERIILPSMPTDSLFKMPEPDFGPDVNITIARRG